MERESDGECVRQSATECVVESMSGRERDREIVREGGEVKSV